MKNETVTLNPDGTLYIVNKSAYYGVDHADRNIRAVSAWMNIPTDNIPEKGTPEHYHYYKMIMNKGAEHAHKNNVKCEHHLKTSQLHGLLGRRVEVVTMYGETRRFNVGKSTGWMPCYLEVENARTRGGCAAEREYQSVKVVR